MKRSPFILVHRGPVKAASAVEYAKKWMREWADSALEDSASALEKVRPGFLGTLVDSVRSARTSGAVVLEPDLKNIAYEKLHAIVSDLNRRPKVKTVGVWDFGARVGRLPDVLQTLNLAQPAITFFEVQAAFPAGLISQPERVVAVAETFARLSPAEKNEVRRNIILEEFGEQAERVRKDLHLDHLVGITPSMVAFEEEGFFYWNYFSADSGVNLLVSSYELRKFSAEAQRPFEVGVAFLVVGALLTIINPGLGFHKEDRGCLFDFNDDRVSIIKALQKMHIEASCLKKIREEYRKSAEVMMKALREYQREPAD